MGGSKKRGESKGGCLHGDSMYCIVVVNQNVRRMIVAFDCSHHSHHRHRATACHMRQLSIRSTHWGDHSRVCPPSVVDRVCSL